MIDPLFAFLGIKSSHAVGGVAGGTVRYLIVGGNYLAGLASATVGLITAAWLTPSFYFAFIKFYPTWNDPSMEGSIGFLLGLTGMVICEGFMKLARRWAANPSVPTL